MSPERFAEVKRVFQEALEREEEEREAFLAEACGGDREVTLKSESPRLLDSPELDPAARIRLTGLRPLADHPPAGPARPSAPPPP
jgi:hypothetical protein